MKNRKTAEKSNSRQFFYGFLSYKSPVHGEYLSRDEGCRLISEEKHAFGHVLRCAETAERRFLRKRTQRVRIIAGVHVGIDDAGRYRIDADMGGSEFSGKCLCEADDRRL